MAHLGGTTLCQAGLNLIIHSSNLAYDMPYGSQPFLGKILLMEYIPVLKCAPLE